MMNAKTFFARHGESEANVRRIISNGRSDVAPLTDLGRQQAEELRDTLGRVSKLTAIYSSPLPRARETAEIVAKGLNVDVAIEDALREPFCGEIEGRGDPEAWALHAIQEGEWAKGNRDFRILGGESLRDVEARYIPFMERICFDRGREDGDVLIVSHGSLLTHMLPRVLANIEPDFVRDHPLRSCAVVVAIRTDEGLECMEWDGVHVGA